MPVKTKGKKSQQAQSEIEIKKTQEIKEYKEEVEQEISSGNMTYNVEMDMNIPKMEEETLSFWERDKIFERSVENRSTDNQYVLFDGPPFATGLPHYGHMLAGALKDVFPRYHTMQGKRVERRFGWDCHGVPIEFEIEKMYKNEGIDFKTQSIAEFNERCRSIVLRHTNEWRKTVKRLGRFIDMDNDYKTMDATYMESVWAIFKKLQEKGLVYEGHRVLAYSTGLRTVLSDFESKLNYQKLNDPEITMAFPLSSDPNVSLLVWTTTPWTVPTNVAVAINQDVPYVKVTAQKDGKKYILAEAAVEKYFPDAKQIKEKEAVEVSDIINQSYSPMFNTVLEQGTECFKVYHGAFVSSENGTGLVHISPAFGEDDFNLGKKYNLPALDFFDKEGCFKAQVPNTADEKAQGELFTQLIGKQFKASNKVLVQYMKDKGRIFKEGVISHDYPLCWRTETPLMYRAVPSWYVKVTDIKDKIIEHNKNINWYPDFVGTKRFHSWLENARDWSVSRNRYWGCPLPIWRNVEDPLDCLFIGSRKELETLTGEVIPDLHSHKIDHLLIKQNGKIYKRVPEVFDCWFESGSMPYGQIHYPFEHESTFLDQHFPADIIAEGLDQTRGWFYTLMVLSTALFDKPAFKNCVVNGIILGTDGTKMSKMKGNYPDINLVFNKYGADAIRFFLLGSVATKAEEVAVSEKNIAVSIQKVLLPIINVYKFFGITANKHNFRYDSHFNFSELQDPINKALMHRIELFRSNISSNYEQYNLVGVCDEIQKYVTYISQWYVRNMKHYIADEQYSLHSETLHCLHYALEIFSKCSGPLLPFISDFIFRNLHGLKQSVHLANWPAPISTESYEPYLSKLEKVQKIVHLGNRIRDEQGIRLRQVLPVLYLNETLREELSIYEDLIKKELNVENIVWVDSVKASEMVVDKKLSLNTSKLHLKYKAEFKEMKEVFDQGNYALLLNGKEILNEEMSTELIYKKGFSGAQNEDLSVVLSTKVDASLGEEGVLRDIMHEVQRLRKKNNLSSMDPIEVSISGGLLELVMKHENKFKAFLAKTHSVLMKALNVTVDKKSCSFGKYTGDIAISHSKSKPMLSFTQTSTVLPVLTPEPMDDSVTVKQIYELLKEKGHSENDIDNMSVSKMKSLYISSKTQSEPSKHLRMHVKDGV